jgi:hypothetical protein
MPWSHMGEWGCISNFLDLDERSEWSASRSCRFTSSETAAGTHYTGGWVGTRAGVDFTEERNPI